MQVVAAGLDLRVTCRTLYIRRLVFVSATVAVSASAKKSTWMTAMEYRSQSAQSSLTALLCGQLLRWQSVPAGDHGRVRMRKRESARKSVSEQAKGVANTCILT